MQQFQRSHREHQERFVQHPVSRPMGVGQDLFGLAKDGREFPIEAGLGRFETTGGFYAVAFVTDVTAKARAAQATRAISHELHPAALDQLGLLPALRANAAAHSEASRITIALHAESDRLKLEVIDEGKGFDFAEVRGARSLGLVSMEERARLIHADLAIESHPGRGTIVRVMLHLDPTK